MSHNRTPLFLLLLAVFVSFPAAARADTVYDISGTITSIGNAGARVTVDYSYVMDVGTVPAGTPFAGEATFAISDESASGSGSLGDIFTMGSYAYGGAPGSYLPITDPEGDEIDLVATSYDYPAVIPTYATWWKCWASCIPDFMPPGFPPDFDVVNAGGNWGAAPFTLTQTVTTPEASTGIMLLLGIPLLPFLRGRSPLRPQPSR